MFTEKREVIKNKEAIVVSGLGTYSLSDTLECGQCFRYEEVTKEEGYEEYIITAHNTIIFVAQREVGELIFFDASDEEFHEIIVPYFNLDTDFDKSLSHA